MEPEHNADKCVEFHLEKHDMAKEHKLTREKEQIIIIIQGRQTSHHKNKRRIEGRIKHCICISGVTILRI